MRALRRFLVFVVVLAVILVVLDRVGDAVAERFTADTIQTSQHLTARPDVGIDGFPFLNQFATGEYSHITLDATDVPVEHTSLYLSSVHADFYDVTVSRSFSNFQAQRGTAQAGVTYAQLSRTLGIQVRYVGQGRIAASKQLHVLGHSVTPTISARLKYVNGALDFGKLTVDGLGDLGKSVAKPLRRLFDAPLNLRGIPFQVRVTSLSADASGVHLALAGSNLHYQT